MDPALSTMVLVIECVVQVISLVTHTTPRAGAPGAGTSVLLWGYENNQI